MADSHNSDRDRLTIVGIAASAGGLEATTLLAQNLPVGINCCYVIAQHMSPSHTSMLVQLLGRETQLTVEELSAETTVKSGVIYIPPPGKDVIYTDGQMKLREPAGHPASPKPSADRLFKSLAEELAENAIGVVFSGTGSDGSYGIRAIRQHGGITIAQEPSSCKYDSMPVSAIHTGCIDLTLTPHQIGEHIAEIVSRPRDTDMLEQINATRHRNKDLFDIIFARTLVDFRQYKESTLNLRIQRRMIAKGLEDIDQYVDLCRTSTDGVDALFRDLLISVTEFFRDREQFDHLAHILNGAVSALKEKSKIRVWVPGCASGEEAYSIAILVCEALGGLSEVSSEKIQIFATDIDEAALQVARRGVYPVSAADDIPTEYVNTHFEVSGENLVVRPKLRNMIMFSRHNVIQDAPFIDIDLVSIRNVIIYFNSKLQERLFTRINYALKPGALLFLGTSESLGVMESHFQHVAGRAKIFRKRDAKSVNERSKPQYYTLSTTTEHRPDKTDYRDPYDEWRNFDRLARGVITNGVLMNREQIILRVYGDLAPYSTITSKSFGKPTLAMFQKSLGADAASLALVALKRGEMRAGQWHDAPGRPGFVTQVTAYPLEADGSEEDLVLIGIQTVERQEPLNTDGEHTEFVTYLEDELARTRDALQVSVEQLQTSNEELQSLNEELQSANEELQSTNEELETSNEELQSTNEKLITVNEELLVNSAQLEKTTYEMNTLVDSISTVLLMLDQGLIIRYASKRAIKLFELSDRAIGFGHLSQCTLPDGYPAFVNLAGQVLVERQELTRKFQIGTTLYQLTISPMDNKQNQQVGAVVQVSSVSDLRTGSEMSELLQKASGVATWYAIPATNETYWSDQLDKIAGPYDKALSLSGTLQSNIHPSDRSKVQTILEKIGEQGGYDHYFLRMHRPKGTDFVAEVHVVGVTDESTGDMTILGTFSNYSEARTRDQLIKHFDKISAEYGIGFYSYDVANDLPYWNSALYDILEIDKSVEPTVELALSRFSDDGRERIQALLQDAISEGKSYDYVEEMTREDGSVVKVHGVGDVAEDGTVAFIFGSFEVLTAES